MTRGEVVMRSGARVSVTPVAPRPRVAQAVFVVLYAGFWFLGWAELPVVGRPEKLVALVGLIALPRAVGSRVLPSTMVTVGLAGVLITYYLSSFVSGLTQESFEFIVSLSARVMFLWMCFVLLQSARALRWATWLLIASSLVASLVALAVMARHGVGIGRTDPMGLETNLLGPVTFSIFASAQLATMGAILLLGASGGLKAVALRLAAPIVSLAICATAYLSYFRREHLISIPLVLIALMVGSGRQSRKTMGLATLVAVIGFGGVVAWDYVRENSVLESRIDSELEGHFVEPDDTRLTNLRAQLDAVSASPLIGYGAGRHAAAITPFVTSRERFLSGFNIVGWLAVEGGLPCALFYMVMLAGMWRVSWRWRVVSGDEPHAIVLRCAPALVIQVMLWGVFGNAWDLPLGWFVLGMILAAASLAERAPGDESHEGGGRTFQYRGMTMPSPA